MRKFNKIIVVVLSLIIGGAVVFHLYERYSPIWFKYAETLAQVWVKYAETLAQV